MGRLVIILDTQSLLILLVSLTVYIIYVHSINYNYNFSITQHVKMGFLNSITLSETMPITHTLEDWKKYK